MPLSWLLGFAPQSLVLPGLKLGIRSLCSSSCSLLPMVVSLRMVVRMVVSLRLSLYGTETKGTPG